MGDEAGDSEDVDDAEQHGAVSGGGADGDRQRLAREDRAGPQGSSRREGAPPPRNPELADELVAEERLELPSQSPLFHAEHAERYDRQRLIQGYERAYDCRLVVVIDAIFAHSINVFEDLVFDADPEQDLHLLLSTPGGDGETAVRLVRSAQARCRELTVIIPDQAKSAGTLLAMGAHRILMGPPSDLGPVDAQFQTDQWRLVSAKDIIAAVEAADRAIQANPETYPLHAALLGDVDAILLQQARSALARSEDLVEEALRSNPSRSLDDVGRLKDAIREPLIERPKSHAAIFGAEDAKAVGLPVINADPFGDQWALLWRLWVKYLTLKARVYEGSRSSKVIPWAP